MTPHLLGHLQELNRVNTRDDGRFLKIVLRSEFPKFEFGGEGVGGGIFQQVLSLLSTLSSYI